MFEPVDSLIAGYFNDLRDWKVNKLKSSKPLSGELDLNYVSESTTRNLLHAHGEYSVQFDGDVDLVPNKYEGGFKIWEGTWDLIHFLDEWLSIKGVERTTNILELGCGSGLAGIFCLKKLTNCQVYFQDFNSQVLRYFTAPNVVVNFESDSSVTQRCKFLSGDWELVAQQLKASNLKFDLIISSETLYNQENYSKLLNVIKSCLSPDGCCYFASKSYYFGVGGGSTDFQEFVTADGEFDCEVCSEIDAPLQRVVLKLVRKGKT